MRIEKTFLILSFSLIIFLITDFSKAQADENKKQANIQVLTDWEGYEIQATGKLNLHEPDTSYSRNIWKDIGKEKMITHIGLFLEDFLIDQNYQLKDILKKNNTFAREYSIFLQNLQLDYFAIRKSYSYMDISIPLRGSRSLLNIMPFYWEKLKYQDLQPAEYVGEAYQVSNSIGSFQNSLVPVKYTGLIIDMRGLRFQPSLSPRIYSENGRLVYGPEYLSREIGVNRGIAGFSRTRSSAEIFARTGKRPMYLAALGVSGKNNTNAVVSNEDQREFFDHKVSIQNLLKCKVMFIID